MIPEDTPPGTEVVCIQIDEDKMTPEPLLQLGAIYTIAGWDIGYNVRGEYGRGVTVREINPLMWCFDALHFRLLELPEELTSLLDYAEMIDAIPRRAVISWPKEMERS